MSNNDTFTDPLTNVLIFGAAGHIASAVADTFQREAPEVALRLATSSASKVEALEKRYPSAQVIECSYFNHDQLNAAMQGIDGVYLITPDFIDMKPAITNFINAAKAARTVRHIVRVCGDADFDIRPHLPKFLQETQGTALGHPQARELLDASGLNVTYTNSAANFMDNLSNHYSVGPIKAQNMIVDMLRHPMFWVDPAEVGEAGAKVLLRRNVDDIGAFIHLNNHEPPRDSAEIATLMTEVLGRQIDYLEDPEMWRKTCGKDIEEAKGAGAAEYMYQYWSMEANLLNDDLLSTINSQLEEILGRTPKTLKQWLTENKAAFNASPV